MKKFKAAVPTVCYTVLLLAIALLSFLIAGKSGVTPTSAQNASSPKENKESPLPTQEIEPTIYDDVFPRKAIDGKQKIYGEGNVFLHDVIQTPVGNFVILTSECKKGDVSAPDPVVAIVKTNENNDLISSYRIAENEKYLTAQQTAIGIVLVTQSSDGKRDSVHIVGYDLLGESKYDIPAGSVRVLPTESGFILFVDHTDECTAYFMQDGKMLFKSLEKCSLVDLFEYEDTYLLFCNTPSGGFYRLNVDKKTLSVSEKKRFGDDVLLCIKPIANGKEILTVEKGTSVFARRYILDAGKMLEEKRLGDFDVTETFSQSDGITVFCDGEIEGYVAIGDDMLPRLCEYADCSVLAVLRTNDERVLLRDANGNVFFSGRSPVCQADKVIPIESPTKKISLFAEKKDVFSYIEIIDLPDE